MELSCRIEHESVEEVSSVVAAAARTHRQKIALVLRYLIIVDQSNIYHSKSVTLMSETYTREREIEGKRIYVAIHY